MLVALGESYEKLSQQVEAKKVSLLQLSQAGCVFESLWSVTHSLLV